jgi:hypothetical protein
MTQCKYNLKRFLRSSGKPSFSTYHAAATAKTIKQAMKAMASELLAVTRSELKRMVRMSKPWEDSNPERRTTHTQPPSGGRGGNDNEDEAEDGDEDDDDDGEELELELLVEDGELDRPGSCCSTCVPPNTTKRRWGEAPLAALESSTRKGSESESLTAPSFPFFFSPPFLSSFSLLLLLLPSPLLWDAVAA